MSALTTLALCSSAAFMAYGVLCLTSVKMRDEFARFGLTRLRVTTGVLEVLGGVGLLVGLRWSPALWLSAAGLALLMCCGIGARVRVKDGMLRTLPAIVLMLVNVYLVVGSLRATSHL